MVKLQGAQVLRYRLVLATLTGTPLQITDIRPDDAEPGLCDFEVSFLRLLEKITNGCLVKIHPTGTKLSYKPGMLVGGRGLVHNCGTSRAIGYFLEPLIILGLFGKTPLSITLKGVTNDWKDPCVDTFRITTLPLLRHFGIPIEDVQLKIVTRGAPPEGGGEVHLKIPIVHTSLTAVNWVDEGLVKRIRGVAYSTRVSPQMSNRMVDSARGVFNNFLPDVYIFTDHYTGQGSGNSPGYGISLVAETTTGCLLSAEAVRNHVKQDGLETQSPSLPEDLGTHGARLLLEEIRRGGVVDSTHQGLLFILCALCPEDVCKVRVGKLTPHAIRVLRLIKDFLNVQFDLKPDPATGTILSVCVGSGYRNISRKVS